MRDLAFVGFLGALLALGLKRPFIWVLAYAYVDIVSPHHLSYFLLNQVPLSLIVASMAMLGWALLDPGKSFRTSGGQWLIALFGAWCAYTTTYADFPVAAEFKWGWVWKAMVWAIFLPFVLRTRLRFESYILFMVLGAASIIIAGGIKTVLAGGGYGALNLMVDSNSGIFESSTASTVAIAIIPLIVWLTRFGTIFPKDWRVLTFAGCLIFACLLIPIGTEARTGLVCIAVLAVLMLRDNNRRFLYATAAGFALLISLPLLPQSFSERMGTISGYQGDTSAMTRLAVWSWTLDYVQENPGGGGFGAYRSNRVAVQTSAAEGSGSVITAQQSVEVDAGRAYHSAYFEVLGEQGYLGIVLYLLIHGFALLKMELVRRRFRRSAKERDRWIAPLATALQHAQIICMVGGLFLGIAYQPIILMLLGVEFAFALYIAKERAAERRALLSEQEISPARFM